MPSPGVARSLQDRGSTHRRRPSASASQSNQSSHTHALSQEASSEASLSLSQLSNAHRVTRAQLRNIVTLPPSHAEDERTLRAISKIEFIFERILEKLADGSTATELLIPFWTRPARRRRHHGTDDRELHDEGAQPTFHWVRFPGSTPMEAKKFGMSASCSEAS
jgi:hypothetical protein